MLSLKGSQNQQGHLTKPRSSATGRVHKSIFSKFSHFYNSNYSTLKTQIKNYFSSSSSSSSTPSVYSISTTGADKLKAKIEVNGVEVLSLFDTCSELNIISSSFAKKLNLNIVSTSDVIISFDNSSSKPLGKTSFQLTQGAKTVDATALVVDKISPDINLLLGWPLLNANHFSLNGFNNTLSFSNFAPISYFSNNTATCEIRTRSRVVVAANSHIYIRFNHNLFYNFLKNNNTSSIFLSPSNTLMKTPLRIGTGELTISNKFISISNWSNVPFTLEKGALIGHGTLNTYKVFSLDNSQDEGIDDSNIYLPTPIQEDFKNLIDDPHRVLTKQEFLTAIQKLLENSSSLTILQKNRLLQFLQKYRFLFSKDPKNPGATTKTTCKVKTDPIDLDPIRCHPYRTSHRALEELRRQVHEMLNSNIIKKSKSPWAFPVVLAMKSDGTWRFCVDYSKLNKNVPRDSFPLPNVDDHLDRLGKAKIFTVIDLASGFWQIPIDENDKEKLAFITPFGTYEWNYMPFGFVNAPSIFQRAISETLDPELYISCLVYVDDIIIFSDDFDSHILDLDRVFKLLGDYHWRIKLSKCQFACESINYLGHRISHGSIQPLERNIDKINNMKIPTNPDELISFLGTAAYYKKFICGYDYLIKPLRDLTKPGAKWDFSISSSAYISYKTIISIFSSSPVLRLPDFTKPFIVKTDTSGYAWGAALVQVHDGIEHPVQYASGTLNSSQRNWPAWKREMYGSLRAILKWSHYLIGEDFTLVTDHQANVYLMDPTRNHPAIINNWIILLSPYKYEVVHRPGKTLFLEDALSRSPNLLSISSSSDNKYNNILSITDNNSNTPVDLKQIISLQKSDPLLKDIIYYISNSLSFPSSITHKYNISPDHFTYEDDVLYYLENISRFPSRRLKRLALPKECHSQIFNLFHDHSLAGHLAFERFWSSISSEYWYADFYSISRKYYDSCHTCNLNRPLKHHNSPIIPIVSSCPFEIIQVDHIIVNSSSKDPNVYKYILVCTDCFSKCKYIISRAGTYAHITCVTRE
ncbi:MAG TPA: reverse transcriptase domain-containing protein [Candidatus Limnocylindrales bacterium]|nr:reverse transcriptase domain-containing protein [Candidatus Limnocylindrales bacterium]